MILYFYLLVSLVLLLNKYASTTPGWQKRAFIVNQDCLSTENTKELEMNDVLSDFNH